MSIPPTPESRLAIFRRGSRTYFMSSLFFPEELRVKVTTLYAFVRIADDFVDQVPGDAQGFVNFEKTYHETLKGNFSGNHVIDAFVELVHREDFDPEWVESFLAAMRSDLYHQPCTCIADTINYMHGSAEVIGLMMARLMKLPPESYPSAMLLGRAMQYINFLRDIHEDFLLGRSYLPADELNHYGFEKLTPSTAKENPKEFENFMHRQIDRYHKWQAEAEAGFHFLPWRARVPIATASDMYKWTAQCILADPFRVFREKTKPSRRRVLIQGVVNSWKQRDALARPS
jgi:phytoene synthase